MTSVMADKALPGSLVDESLIWSLMAFRRHERAVSFATQLSRRLCVYSSKVHQLYASYDILVPEDGGGAELVISPHLENFLDMWFSIPEAAIRSTEFTIVPGHIVQREGLALHQTGGGAGQGRVVGLEPGLRLLREQYELRNDVFLPVITKGDLRAFRKEEPVMHLHRLDFNAMGDKSAFELRDIREGILKRLRSGRPSGAR